jgi:hypothetical protein
MGELYGASLVCNEEAAERIEERQAAGDFLTPQTSFAGTAATSQILSSTDNVTSLATRVIDVVEYRIAKRKSVSSKRDRHHVAQSSSVLKEELMLGFEILWEEGCEPLVHSSRTALSFLTDRQPSSACTSSGEALIPPLVRLRSHLSLFPNDSVMMSIFRRAVSLTTSRSSSILGLDLTLSEYEGVRLTEVLSATNVHPRHTVPASEAQHRETHFGSDSTAPRQSNIFSRICAAEDYVIYFTDM